MHFLIYGNKPRIYDVLKLPYKAFSTTEKRESGIFFLLHCVFASQSSLLFDPLCSFNNKHNRVKINTNTTHGNGYNVDDKRNKCRETGDCSIHVFYSFSQLTTLKSIALRRDYLSIFLRAQYIDENIFRFFSITTEMH